MVLMAATAGVLSVCSAPTEAESARAQHFAYIDRSVQIVALAADGDEELLADFVDSTAEFSLGSGDVVVPLGNGVQGALTFGERLNAAQYSYSGWDYMDYAHDACGPIEIEVRFVDDGKATFSTVTFSFNHGKLVSAGGWTQSLYTGQMSEVLDSGRPQERP